jgi:hypothetical protein
MARMDSLEMTIQSLLDGVDFDDNEDTNWSSASNTNLEASNPGAGSDAFTAATVTGTASVDDSLKDSVESKNP